jgi:hypothetical protein
MNTVQTATLAFLLLAVVSEPSIAAENHYECLIVSAGKLTEEGALSPHWTNKSIVGTKFTVDRVTGRIIRGPLDNSNMKIEVIDKGSNEMSFQSFSRSTARTHSTYIEIQEFIPGEGKPFVGTTTLYYPGVYSGICR